MSILVTRKDFIKRYDKPKTQKQITLVFIAWDRFLQYKDITEDELFAELRHPEMKARRYVLLDQVVQFWKETKGAATILNYFNFLKAWWKYNEIELDDSRIRYEIKFPKKIRDRVRGVDRTMIKNMIDLCNPIYKALWYVLAYSGMRIGETLSMEWSWIDFDSKPLKITIPGKYTKTGQERITFVGGEAEDWLRKNRQAQGKVFNMTYTAVSLYFRKKREKLGYLDKTSSGFYHFRLHKLRGYAENRLARAVNPEFAHSILGHTEGLIEYNQGGTTDDEAAKDYLSAMPFLAISDEGRLKDENEKLKDQVSAINEIKRNQELLQAFLESNPKLAKEFALFVRN